MIYIQKVQILIILFLLKYSHGTINTFALACFNNWSAVLPKNIFLSN